MQGVDTCRPKTRKYRPGIAAVQVMSTLMPSTVITMRLLRGIVALIFMAHAVVRLANGSIPQFGAFLESRGLPAGVFLVHAISAFEIIGGGLLAVGVRVKWICSGLTLIVLGGIALIHAQRGWFVGEHGIGGMEFSWLLVFALLALAAEDHARAAERPAASA